MRGAEDAIFPISYSLPGREPEALQPLGLRRTRRRTSAAFSFSPSVGCEDDVALLRFDHLSAYLSDFLHSRVISTARTAHVGDRTVQNLLAEFRSMIRRQGSNELDGKNSWIHQWSRNSHTPIKLYISIYNNKLQ